MCTSCCLQKIGNTQKLYFRKMFHLKYRGLKISAQQSSLFLDSFHYRGTGTPNCGINSTAIYRCSNLILQPLYRLDCEMAEKVIKGDMFLVKSFSLDFEIAQNLVHLCFISQLASLFRLKNLDRLNIREPFQNF